MMRRFWKTVAVEKKADGTLFGSRLAVIITMLLCSFN